MQLAELADRVRGLEAADSGDRVAQQAVDAAEGEGTGLGSAGVAATAHGALLQRSTVDHSSLTAASPLPMRAAERDELRSALQSSLARLEETTSLLALADPTVSGLGRQLQEAEAERQAAVEDAAAAQQQAQAAQQDAEDLRWRVRSGCSWLWVDQSCGSRPPELTPCCISMVPAAGGAAAAAG